MGVRVNSGALEFSFWKDLLSAIHAAIIFLALIPARATVSKVMGLSAQDFDGAVGLVGVFIYPGLWLSITSFVILICAAVMLVAGFICQMTCMPGVDDVIKLLADFSGGKGKGIRIERKTRFFDMYVHTLERCSGRVVGHQCGRSATR